MAAAAHSMVTRSQVAKMGVASTSDVRIAWEEDAPMTGEDRTVDEEDVQMHFQENPVPSSTGPFVGQYEHHQQLQTAAVANGTTILGAVAQSQPGIKQMGASFVADQNRSTTGPFKALPSSCSSSSSSQSCSSSPSSFSSTSYTPSKPFGAKSMDATWGVESADVHQQMRERENIHRTYNPEARWLKYRRVLVDWMCEAGDEFNLHISTMHVAVMYLDRILHSVVVARNRLQLVAIACILIAAKYEEIEEDVPTLTDMNKHAQGVFSPRDIQQMEFEVLKKMNWCLGTFTPLHFADYYMSKGVLFEADTMQRRSLSGKVVRYVHRYIEFFAELCLQDYQFQRFSPSMMAAAIIMASRKALYIAPLWRPELTKLTQYSLVEIEPCFKAVWNSYAVNFPNAPQVAQSPSDDYSPIGVDEF